MRRRQRRRRPISSNASSSSCGSSSSSSSSSRGAAAGRCQQQRPPVGRSPPKAAACCSACCRAGRPGVRALAVRQRLQRPPARIRQRSRLSHRSVCRCPRSRRPGLAYLGACLAILPPSAAHYLRHPRLHRSRRCIRPPPCNSSSCRCHNRGIHQQARAAHFLRPHPCRGPRSRSMSGLGWRLGVCRRAA